MNYLPLPIPLPVPDEATLRSSFAVKSTQQEADDTDLEIGERTSLLSSKQQPPHHQHSAFAPKKKVTLSTSNPIYRDPTWDSTKSSSSHCDDSSDEDDEDDVDGGAFSEMRNHGNGKSHMHQNTIHRLSYTPQNHTQVLFQMYGSALPQVLPFCLVNCLWLLTVHALKNYDMIDITFQSTTGHTFMGLLVSFLIVERCRVSYSRFMENRKYLADCYRTCREMIQLGCAYTFQAQTQEAKQWRQEFAYRIILLLRVTMDALEWASTHKSQWERKYFDQQPQDEDADDKMPHTKNQKKRKKQQKKSTKCYRPHLLQQESEHVQALKEFSHGDRTWIDENFRAPLLFEYALRETIMVHPDFLGYKLHANEYRDLVLSVSEFNKAFHGFRVLLFTPYPFALVQMTRLFLFFWVYSLPLVLVDQMNVLYHSLVMIFLITFGFVGTEYVSMTLDDPFGNQVNDIDHTGMAELVFEDIYLTLYKADGLEAARKVKKRVMERYALQRELDCYHQDFRSDDFWKHTSTRPPTMIIPSEHSSPHENPINGNVAILGSSAQDHVAHVI